MRGQSTKGKLTPSSALAYVKLARHAARLWDPISWLEIRPRLALGKFFQTWTIWSFYNTVHTCRLTDITTSVRPSDLFHVLKLLWLIKTVHTFIHHIIRSISGQIWLMVCQGSWDSQVIVGRLMSARIIQKSSDWTSHNDS